MITKPVNRHCLEAELNGRRISILLDTGSDLTLIQRRLVDDPRNIFRGAKQFVSGLVGTESIDEMCQVLLAGEGVQPIGLFGYLMNELPDVDIIVGRCEMPLLLKPEALDEGRLYYDTVFGRVYMFDRAEEKARMAQCYRAALVDEPRAEEQPQLMKEILARQI